MKLLNIILCWRLMFHVSDVDYTDKLFDFDAHNEVDVSSDDSGFEKEGL